jgi:sterol 3beta-glucosyltransferase
VNITILTFGSRGDVQPFLALAVALRERGHNVMLVAPNDLESHYKSYGIPYTLIPLSILEMDVVKRVTQEGLTPATLIALWREAIPELKRALQTTAHIVSEKARNTDLLISHGFLIPFAYSIHQHLKVPLMLGIAAPIIATQTIPSAAFPPIPFGQRIYNPLTYDWLVRAVTSFMIDPMNAYRREVGLPKLSAGKVIQALFSGQFPIAMHYSKHLIAPPSDWGANVHVVGAWTLPLQEDWTPPDALSAFLAQGEPPVFIGFGSMPVGHPERMSKTISDALRLAGLRGVLQAGWAGLAHEDEHLITIGDVPHEWLFPRMAAIVHHGGSGTTHAALRAGKPALIVPFSADQPMWGRCIAELGVGVPPIAPKRINVERLAAALRTLTQDTAIRQRAAEMGALLRAEDGLAATCALVEQHV